MTLRRRSLKSSPKVRQSSTKIFLLHASRVMLIVERCAKQSPPLSSKLTTSNRQYMAYLTVLPLRAQESRRCPSTRSSPRSSASPRRRLKTLPSTCCPKRSRAGSKPKGKAREQNSTETTSPECQLAHLVSRLRSTFLCILASFAEHVSVRRHALFALFAPKRQCPEREPEAGVCASHDWIRPPTQASLETHTHAQIRPDLRPTHG
eukprot:1018389-Rhodomonas_salina.1